MNADQHLTKITEQRIEILRLIEEEGPLRPGELRDETGRTSSSLSRLLSRMTEEGWLENPTLEVRGRKIENPHLYGLTGVGRKLVEVIQDFEEK